MRSTFLLQATTLLLGLLLIQIFMFLDLKENSNQLNITMIYVALPPINGFLLKLVHFLIFYRFIKTRPWFMNLVLNLIDLITKVSFLSCALYLVVTAGNQKNSFFVAWLYTNFLVLEDYLEYTISNYFKFRLFFMQGKFASVFGPALNGCILLAALLYAFIHFESLPTSNSYFSCIMIILIVYTSILRLIFLSNQSKSYESIIQTQIVYSNSNQNADNSHPNEYFMATEHNTLKIDDLLEPSNRLENQRIRSHSFNLYIKKQAPLFSPNNKVRKSEEFPSPPVIQHGNPSIASFSNNNNKQNVLTSPFRSSFSQFPSNNSNESYTIRTSKRIKTLWEYLPTLFKEGVAIFENDIIVNSNCAFVKCISGILDKNILQDDLNVNWQMFFSEINMTSVDAKSTISLVNDELNLKNEVLNFIHFSLDNPQQEIHSKYSTHKENKIYQICIFKKFLTGEKNFTILKIDDISQEYNKLSRNASKTMKKLFRLSLTHEAQTPLNYLITTTKLLKDEIPEKSYNQIKRPTKLLQFVLNGIFKLAFIENLKHIECIPQRISISTVIQKVLKNLKPLFESRDLALIFENPSTQDEDFIYHDKIIIETIIYQLLANSLKFTKKGKVVVRLFWDNNEENFKISFIDTGIGMTKAEKTNLVSFLESGTNDVSKISEHSTGANIGLNMCKSLIRKIHAAQDETNRILFESQENVGSTFTIVISKYCPNATDDFHDIIKLKTKNKITSMTSLSPVIKNNIYLQDENQESIGSDEKLPQFYFMLKQPFTYKFMSALGSTKALKNNNYDCNCPFRVLVVDDEEFNTISFKAIYLYLTKNASQKHELLVKYDGKDGLSTFMNYFKHYNCGSLSCCPIKVVVLDYNMPGLIGPDVVAAIHDYLVNEGKENDVHIYGWTAYIGEKYQNDFRKAGATDILSKPIKTKELSQILSKFLEL